MRIEDMTAEARPRSHWEAVDLGLALVRRNFPRLLAAWLLCIGPLWAILLALSHWIGPLGFAFFVWWLKPVYDRVPLFHLSRALFGAPPKLRDTLRSWPGLLVSHLLSALVTRRLRTTRALLLPVQMLEGLKGGALRERSAILTRHSGDPATKLFFCCATYEAILVFGLVMLLWMFLPETASYDFSETILESGLRREDIPEQLLWIIISCWMVSLTLVEIFFVGGSFGLYLNSRTHLEGWDVELAFRRLGHRLAGAAAALALLLAPVLAHAAGKTAPEPGTKASAKEEIQTVLASEDFKIHKMKIRLPSKSPDLGDLSGFGGFMKVLGQILFWAAVAFALWKLIEFILRNRHAFIPRPASTAAALKPVRTLAGLDVAPESLPDDVVRAARELAAAGDFHGALSLLYRGSLSWLIHRAGLPVRDSDTEGDCRRHVLALPDTQRRAYFETLSTQWIAVAYAGRAPAAQTLDALFQDWPFDPRVTAQ